MWAILWHLEVLAKQRRLKRTTSPLPLLLPLKPPLKPSLLLLPLKPPLLLLPTPTLPLPSNPVASLAAGNSMEKEAK